MSIQQWNSHSDHMDEHVKWPASRDEIYAACAGEDVEPSVLAEIKTKLTDNKKYSEKEVKRLLVTN